ncbi:MAG: acyl carrier protein [Solirubrobacteraceae bacterium]
MTNVETVKGRDAAVVRAEMSKFIKENFLYMRPDHVLADDDDLMGLALLDSLGFVELVDEVQNRYGIRIQDVDITEEHFGSVNAIAAFVSSGRLS